MRALCRTTRNESRHISDKVTDTVQVSDIESRHVKILAGQAQAQALRARAGRGPSGRRECSRRAYGVSHTHVVFATPRHTVQLDLVFARLPHGEGGQPVRSTWLSPSVAYTPRVHTEHVSHERGERVRELGESRVSHV